MDIYKARRELQNMGTGKLLALTMSQKEARCLLNDVCPCPFLLKYKESNFCVSELLHQGCQREKFEGKNIIENEWRDTLNSIQSGFTLFNCKGLRIEPQTSSLEQKTPIL
jgi:hypothetical protein